MTVETVSLAIVGSGGAGVMTCGQLLLEAAARAGWYGLMTRSFGPQIRGGEAAAFVTLSGQPLESASDRLDLLVAIDWQNITRFIDELPLDGRSLVISDPSQGAAPDPVVAKGPQVRELALRTLSQTINDGRPNMIAVGAVAALIGLPATALTAAAVAMFGRKKAEVVAAATASFQTGATAVADWPQTQTLTLAPPVLAGGAARWSISGNEAAGLGALRGGVRFCAAYPITPATDILEWLAPRLGGVGGALVQAEDELASINMCLGASFGGVPSITATSGPGLALMAEALGLAVASETPVVVVNVMRGGPSTGIPTKSEQVDLDIALHGLHGDAPHLVLAPTSIPDCLRTTQWAVCLAEGLQTPAIVLSDQTLGQARAVIDAPAELDLRARRVVVEPVEGAVCETSEAGEGAAGVRFSRYALTETGVSPAAIPGLPGCEHIAEGLEHSEAGLPSTRVSDHQAQLDKRANKLAQFDFGDGWADVEGDGEIAIITWGSCTGAARAAIRRLAESRGLRIRLIAPRLLLPAQPERMRMALDGVRQVLVLEMSHGQQFYRYLRSYYDLPALSLYHRPGPLPMRAFEVADRLATLV